MIQRKELLFHMSCNSGGCDDKFDSSLWHLIAAASLKIVTGNPSFSWAVHKISTCQCLLGGLVFGGPSFELRGSQDTAFWILWGPILHLLLYQTPWPLILLLAGSAAGVNQAQFTHPGSRSVTVKNHHFESTNSIYNCRCFSKTVRVCTCMYHAAANHPPSRNAMMAITHAASRFSGWQESFCPHLRHLQLYLQLPLADFRVLWCNVWQKMFKSNTPRFIWLCLPKCTSVYVPSIQYNSDAMLSKRAAKL